MARCLLPYSIRSTVVWFRKTHTNFERIDYGSRHMSHFILYMHVPVGKRVFAGRSILLSAIASCHPSRARQTCFVPLLSLIPPQLASLGMLDVSVYAIEPGSILVSSQQGWEGKQVRSRDSFPPTVLSSAWLVVGYSTWWVILCTNTFFPVVDAAAGLHRRVCVVCQWT